MILSYVVGKMLTIERIETNMPHGGARPGAGFPKGQKARKTIEKELFRQRFMEKMRERWDEIIDAQIDLAKGFALIDKSDDTGNRIFEKAPDASAGKNLMDQTMGRAIERVDVTSDGERIFALPSELIEKHDITSSAKPENDLT